MLKSGLNNLWPTQVYKGSILNKHLDPTLNAIFQDVDLDHPYSDFQDFDILNDGPEALINFKDKVVWPAFENYFKEIGMDLKEFPNRSLRSWITGTRNGYMIPAHNHSGSSVSAVFYLMCEEDNQGGELVAIDPRTNANRGYKDEFKPLFANLVYAPQSGEYLMFPSYLYHHTNVFTGSLRLAMPVDLFL
jgi:hypothetical protein